jgi:SNF2 family DNA or RNA helicase
MELPGITLRPYQVHGVTWMLHQESLGGGFLCDEMGLGKTIQMLKVIQMHGGSTLVIAPKSVVHQWESEIKLRCIHTECKVTTYQKAEIYMGTKWHRVILDEAHEVRNKNTKTHKRIKCINADVHWLVTGTPVFNSMSDFASLCSFIGISQGDVQRDSDSVRDSRVLRRTKADLEEQQLPMCHIDTIDIPMGEEEEKIYVNLFAKNAIRAKSLTKQDSMLLLEMFLRLRQLMIWPSMVPDVEYESPSTQKMDRLLSLLQEHPDEKALIFTQFHAESDHIKKVLTEMGFPVFRIDGSVDEAGRVNQISKFKKAPNRAVFLIQIKAGGQGLNLQEASRVYIIGPAWNPATELQAIARAHRTGQTREVHVKRLIYTCNGAPSIEESIQELQNHKMVITSEVLKDPRLAPTGRRLTALELKKFFV